MKRWLILLLLCLPQISWGAELIGPTSPIAVYRRFRIAIRGMTPEQLRTVSITCELPEGVKTEDIELFGGFDFQMRPYIDFSSIYAGKYVVTISEGKWEQPADLLIAQQRASAALQSLNPPLRVTFLDIEELHTKDQASCVIEVTGTGPGPNPPVPPPPPVVEGKRVIAIIYETDPSVLAKLNIDPQALDSLFTALRTGQTANQLSGKGHRLLILDDDLVDKDGRPNADLARIIKLASEKQGTPIQPQTGPVVVIMNPNADSVYSVDKLPIPASYKTADIKVALDKFLTLIKDAGG